MDQTIENMKMRRLKARRFNEAMERVEDAQIKQQQDQERFWRWMSRAASGECGRGGGLNDRQDPTDRREHEDNSEFDEFGRRKKHEAASSVQSDKRDRQQAALERLRQRPRAQDKESPSREDQRERSRSPEQPVRKIKPPRPHFEAFLKGSMGASSAKSRGSNF